MPPIVSPPPGLRVKEAEYVLHPFGADDPVQRMSVRVELESVPILPPPDTDPIIVEG